MPRVDGEEDPVVSLERQIEIAEHAAFYATSPADKQRTRCTVDQLKEQIARLHHREVIELDDEITR